jgi:hypothetical protein
MRFCVSEEGFSSSSDAAGESKSSPRACTDEDAAKDRSNIANRAQTEYFFAFSFNIFNFLPNYFLKITTGKLAILLHAMEQRVLF